MFKLNNLTLFCFITLLFNICSCGSNTENAITNKNWGVATILNESTAESPQIDIDKNDNIIAVWEDYSDESLPLNAMASLFTKNTGWLSKGSIENNNTHHAYRPKISFDDSGNAIAVWHQTVEAEINSFALYSIWVNHYTPSNGWGAPQLIETDETGPAYSPDIAFDTAGNAIVIWSQSDGAHFSMWANHYSKDNGWGIAELIETSDTGDASLSPANVHFDNNGNAIAVWSQSDGINSNIMANQYTPNQGWGVAMPIESNDSGDAYAPQIIFDDSGNAFVVWYQSNGNVFSIWENQFIVDSGWLEPSQIEFDDTGDAYRPRLGIDNNNSVIVVWSQSTNPVINGETIWTNRFNPDSGWDVAIPIGDSDSSGIGTSPEIAVNKSGDAVVVWQQTTFGSSISNIKNSTYTDNIRKLSAPSYNIWANNYNSKTGWEAAKIIDDGNAGFSSSSTQIVINNNGNAVAVWGSSSKLWWNIFE